MTAFAHHCACSTSPIIYIAAGSVALAAKIQKVKLPTQQGKVRWLEFDVSPKQLNEVVLRMMGPDRKKALPPENGRVIAAETLPRKPSSIDEGGGNEIVSAQTNGSKIDIDRIRDAMKRRRRDKDVNKNVPAIDDEIDPEDWIENELENGVELKSRSARKKQRW